MLKYYHLYCHIIHTTTKLMQPSNSSKSMTWKLKWQKHFTIQSSSFFTTYRNRQQYDQHHSWGLPIHFCQHIQLRRLSFVCFLPTTSILSVHSSDHLKREKYYFVTIIYFILLHLTWYKIMNLWFTMLLMSCFAKPRLIYVFWKLVILKIHLFPPSEEHESI